MAHVWATSKMAGGNSRARMLRRTAAAAFGAPRPGGAVPQPATVRFASVHPANHHAQGTGAQKERTPTVVKLPTGRLVSAAHASALDVQLPSLNMRGQTGHQKSTVSPAEERITAIQSRRAMLRTRAPAATSKILNKQQGSKKIAHAQISMVANV